MHENERSQDAVDIGSVSATCNSARTRGNAAFNGLNALAASIRVFADGAMSGKIAFACNNSTLMDEMQLCSK